MRIPPFRLLPFALLAAFFLLGGGCSKTARQERLLEQAQQHFAAGRYDDAEITYLNLLKLAPDHPRAIARLGVIYFDQGRLSRAAPYLLHGRELKIEDPDMRVRLAAVLSAGGRLPESRVEIDSVLARRPHDDDAPILLAEAATKPAELAEARTRLETLIQTTGESASLHVALGTLDLRQGKPEAADAAFRKALQVDPKSSVAYSALGNLQRFKGDPAGAGEAYAKAAEYAPPRSPRKMHLVRFKLQTGDLPAAKRALEEITRQTPDYLPALAWLAEVAFAERRLDDCAGLLERVLTRDPAQLEALLLRGRLKLAQGKPDAAVADFERGKTLFSKSPQAHYHYAMAILGRGKNQEAIAGLNQAIALDPDFPDAIMALAGLQMLKGDFPAAIDGLKPLVQRRPQLARAQILLADAHRGRGDYAEALRLYQAQEQTQPKSPELPLMRGLILLKQGKPTEARAAFERAVEIAPDFPPALEQLLGFAVRDKQLEPITTRLDGLIAAGTTRPEVFVLRARLALVQTDPDRAEAALKQALALKPDFRDAYLLLAGVYNSSSRQKSALATLRDSVTRNASDITAWMMIGMISEHERNWDEARAAYEKAIGLNPRFVPALNNLAWMYAEHFKLLDKAVEMARKAREFNAVDPQIADTLGWILYRRGDYQWSLSLLQESAHKLPDNGEIQFHLGMVYYMMGAEEPARAALQRALAAGTAFTGDDEARTCAALLAIDPATAGPAERTLLEQRLAIRSADPIALSRRAALHERAGEPAKAIAVFRGVLSAYPQNTAAMLNLARLTAGTDPKGAMEIARAAYKLAPDEPAVAVALGRLAYQTGEFAWAASLLQQAAKKLPADAQLSFDLALAHYSVGAVAEAGESARAALVADARFSRAAEATLFLDLLALAANPSADGKVKIQDALRTQPESVPALLALAALAERDGDRKSAAATYRRALLRFPDFTPALRRLALLSALDDRDSKATAELLTRARAAFPNDAEIAKALGVAAYRAGDFRRAATLLRESTAARADDAESFYLLGLSCLQLKERSAARPALTRALELDPQNVRAAEARAALQELK